MTRALRMRVTYYVGGSDHMDRGCYHCVIMSDWRAGAMQRRARQSRASLPCTVELTPRLSNVPYNGEGIACTYRATPSDTGPTEYRCEA
jgi:hypothetical protein